MNRTPVVAVAISALLLGSLSGCFLLPNAPEPKPSITEETESEPEQSTAFASIGDCWETNFADMAEWQVWEGDAPVDCDETHQSYTYFAGPLEVDVSNAWLDGSMTGELSSAVSAQCEPGLRELGVPADAARVQWYYFVAPEEDWEAGDHSIRCDVAVSALDSDWYEPELEKLPSDIADLVDDVDRHVRSYELCLVGDAFGPYESAEAYYADCAGDYYWRFAGNIEYPSQALDAYPTGDSLIAFAETECAGFAARSGESVLPYIPTLEMWTGGYRDVRCWFSVIDEPSTAV